MWHPLALVSAVPSFRYLTIDPFVKSHGEVMLDLDVGLQELLEHLFSGIALYHNKLRRS